MSLIEWNDELVLGVAVIDGHHQHLVSLLNKAHDAFIWGLTPGELTATLQELTDYANYHFAAEEELMQAHHYSGLAAHQREHAAFRDRIATMGHNPSGDSFPAYLELIEFLLEWLVTHIKTVDRQTVTAITTPSAKE